MSDFFSGSVTPFWPHVLLLTVAIAASFAVAVGIVMENPKWSLANALVVGGVAIEAACTLLLFGFDEGITGKQQSRIEEQQSTIIALEDRELLPSEREAIGAKLRPFSHWPDGPKINLVGIIRNGNPEVEKLTEQFRIALNAGGWNFKVWLPISWSPGPDFRGISLQVDKDASQETKDEAAALLAAIPARLQVDGAPQGRIGFTDANPILHDAKMALIISTKK